MSVASLSPYVLNLKQAFSALARGASDTALAHVRAALAAAPDGAGDAVAYELAAGLTAAAGEPEAAVALLVAAQQRHPDLPLYRCPDFRLRQRRAIARGVPPLLLVTQFKSASLFLTDVLAKGLDLPTCYVACAPLSERIVPEWLDLFARGGALAQNHLLPSAENLAVLAASPLRRFAVHLRDPRQSMISAVHHYVADCRRDTASGIVTRAKFPVGFPDWPAARQIDHYLDHCFPDDVAWTAGWIAAARRPPPGIAIWLSDFETFRRDPEGFFAGLLDFFAIAPGTFDDRALAAPRPGRLHFRKGEVAEWRRVLTPDQAARATALLPSAVAARFTAA